MSYEFNDLLFNDQDDDTFFNLSSSKAEQQDQTTPQQNGSLSNEEFTPENFLDFDSSLYMGDIDKDYSSEEINTPTDNQDIVLSSTSTIGQDHVLNSSTDSMVEEFNKSVNVFTRKWSSSLDMEISTNSKIDVFLPVILKFVPEDKGLIPYEIRLQEVYAHYDLGLNHIKWQNQSTTLWCAEFESLPFPDLNSEYSNPLGGFKLIHTWAHPTWFRDCSGSSKTKMYLKLRKPNVGQNELIPFNDVKRFNFYNPPKSSRTLQVFNPEIQGVKKPIYPNTGIPLKMVKGINSSVNKEALEDIFLPTKMVPNRRKMNNNVENQELVKKRPSHMNDFQIEKNRFLKRSSSSIQM